MTAPESRRSRAPRGSLMGKRSWPAGNDGKRRAAAVLEVLAGMRTPAEAATALGVSMPAYYLMEQRAVAGLVAACETVGRGPRPTAQRQMAALERQLAHVKRERDRYQALARMAQRSLGLAAPSAPPQGKTTGKAQEAGVPARRRRRATVRALRVASALRKSDSSSTQGAAAVEQPSAPSS